MAWSQAVRLRLVTHTTNGCRPAGFPACRSRLCPRFIVALTRKQTYNQPETGRLHWIWMTCSWWRGRGKPCPHAAAILLDLEPKWPNVAGKTWRCVPLKLAPWVYQDILQPMTSTSHPSPNPKVPMSVIEKPKIDRAVVYSSNKGSWHSDDLWRCTKWAKVALVAWNIKGSSVDKVTLGLDP